MSDQQFRPAHSAFDESPEVKEAAALSLAGKRLDRAAAEALYYGASLHTLAQLALFYGANDFGSLMIEENVVAAAGVSYHLTRHEIHKIIRAAGFTPVQRTMNYTPVNPQPED